MNPEIERSWHVVEMALGKRYPELQKLLNTIPKDEKPGPLVQELYRLSRDVEELNHKVSRYKRHGFLF